MANIKQLKENNQNVYPVTHEQAVMDNDGISISEKLASLLSEVNTKANNTHTHNYLPLNGGTITGSLTGTTFIGALNGNASTATKLQTPRTINGVNFDGSANITINANPNAHNQASSTVTAMTGYTKASAASAITTGDSLNTAIGKLEKALDSYVKAVDIITEAEIDAIIKNALA